VILIDAVQSGHAPGTIHRFDASHVPVPRRFFNYSTHAFGVAESVELARVLNQLPPQVILYGIEGKDFTDGANLSSEVAATVGDLLGRVGQEIERIMTNDPTRTRGVAIR
jgi:hydrogenase maturation protease